MKRDLFKTGSVYRVIKTHVCNLIIFNKYKNKSEIVFWWCFSTVLKLFMREGCFEPHCSIYLFIYYIKDVGYNIFKYLNCGGECVGNTKKWEIKPDYCPAKPHPTLSFPFLPNPTPNSSTQPHTAQPCLACLPSPDSQRPALPAQLCPAQPLSSPVQP